MNTSEKRLYLIKYLLGEKEEYKNIEIPENSEEQFKLYRSLVNVRQAKAISEEYLKVEDEYLKELIAEKGVTDIADLSFKDGVCVWQGDITTLASGAIVNAANSALLGCFYPCHGCIDNAIHTFAGVRLRAECADIMEKQNAPEPTTKAKITQAYNLPADYVIHTVGPIVSGALTSRHKALLALCYSECLSLACKKGIESIAFPCISTGEFHFPNAEAAKIAIKTVKEFKEKNNSEIKVIFNVFKDYDKRLYEEILASER